MTNVMGSKSKDWAISSQAVRTAEGSTAIPQGSRIKRSEVHGVRVSRTVIWSGLNRDIQHRKMGVVSQATFNANDMGDEYFGIAHPTTWRNVKNDLEGVYQYRDEGFQMIYNGEIGKFEGVRFIEQNNVTKAQMGTFTTNAKSNGAMFFGEDTVAEAIVVPEEIRGAIPQDFGRSKSIAWYYLGKSICPLIAQAVNDNIVNSGEALAA